MNWTALNPACTARMKLVGLATCSLLMLIYLLFGTSTYSRHAIQHRIATLFQNLGSGHLLLQAYYRPKDGIGKLGDTCAGGYGTDYLRAFSESAMNCCANSSAASLTCLSLNTSDTRTDTH